MIPSLRLVSTGALLLVALTASAQTEGTWSDVFAYPGARLTQAGYGYYQQPAEVQAVRADGRGGYYVAGRFTSIDGVALASVAHWDGQAWTPLGGGLRANNGYNQQPVMVHDLLVASDGSVYVVGEFDTAIQRNGRAVTASGIARWAGSSWESVGGGVYASPYSQAAAYALAEAPDGSIYVAGAFEGVVTSTGVTIATTGIARWQGGQWSRVIVGEAGSSVGAVAVRSDGAVAIGGTFSDGPPSYQYVYGILLIAPDGTRQTILNGASITTLAWNGDALYAGGQFGIYGSGPDVQNVARWDGTSWSGLDGGVNNPVVEIIADEADGAYVVGTFTTAGSNGLSAPGVAHWTGSAWEVSGGVLVPDYYYYYESPQVRTVAVNGSEVVIGGLFEGVQGESGEATSAASIAVRRGTDWRPLSRFSGRESVGRRSSLNYNRAAVLASTPSPCGRGVLIAGTIPSVGAQTTLNVGWWDGQTWTAFPGRFSNPYEEVRTVTPTGCVGGRPQFFIAGTFTGLLLDDGTDLGARGVAYWDGVAWSALQGVAPEGAIQAAVYDGQTLYVAGTLFQQQQGNSYNAYGVYSWQAGRGWRAVGGGVDGQVTSLALDAAGRLYVGGSFSSVRQPSGLSIGVGGLARWSGTAWEWIGNPTSNDIQSMAIGPDGRLYVGGSFDTFAQPSRPNVTARYVAMWDGDTWADYGALVAPASALAVGAGGRIYAGLGRDPYGYLPEGDRLFVAGPDGWQPLGVTDGGVAALTLDGNDLYVGGTFMAAGTTPSAYLALYTDPLATPSASRPGGGALALSVAPNPVQGRATLTIEVPEAVAVRAAVYDALGREVAVLWEGMRTAGPLVLDLDATRLPAGVYVARVQAGAATTTRTLTVVR